MLWWDRIKSLNNRRRSSDWEGGKHWIREGLTPYSRFPVLLYSRLEDFAKGRLGPATRVWPMLEIVLGTHGAGVLAIGAARWWLRAMQFGGLMDWEDDDFYIDCLAHGDRALMEESHCNIEKLGLRDLTTEKLRGAIGSVEFHSRETLENWTPNDMGLHPVESLTLLACQVLNGICTGLVCYDPSDVNDVKRWAMNHLIEQARTDLYFRSPDSLAYEMQDVQVRLRVIEYIMSCSQACEVWIADNSFKPYVTNWMHSRGGDLCFSPALDVLSVVCFFNEKDAAHRTQEESMLRQMERDMEECVLVENCVLVWQCKGGQWAAMVYATGSDWSETVRIALYIVSRKKGETAGEVSWGTFQVRSKVACALSESSAVAREMRAMSCFIARNSGQSYRKADGLRMRVASEISRSVGFGDVILRCSPWLSWKSVLSQVNT